MPCFALPVHISGADLSKCKFLRFMDIHYRRAGGDQTVTILIPEVCICGIAVGLGTGWDPKDQ